MIQPASDGGSAHSEWGIEGWSNSALIAPAPCKRKASLTRGQQLLSKLVCTRLEACTPVHSQLKSNELYDSVTLLIHQVSLPRDCGDNVGGQRCMKLLMLKRSLYLMAPAAPASLAANQEAPRRWPRHYHLSTIASFKTDGKELVHPLGWNLLRLSQSTLLTSGTGTGVTWLDRKYNLQQKHTFLLNSEQHLYLNSHLDKTYYQLQSSIKHAQQALILCSLPH